MLLGWGYGQVRFIYYLSKDMIDGTKQFYVAGCRMLLRTGTRTLNVNAAVCNVSVYSYEINA
jgi:hypothetical protein